MARRSARRLPRQAQPIGIELGYFRALSPIVKAMTRATDRLIAQLEDVLNDARMDAPRAEPASEERARIARARKRAEMLIDAAAGKVSDSLRPQELEAVAARFGRQTSAFQKEQLARQVRAAASIDLDKIGVVEKGIKASVDAWIAENVTLIKTLSPVYFDDVKQRTFDAIERGTRHERLAEELRERYEIPENRAALIARDQVGKLYGNLNAQRQQNLGVTGYIWRTVRDNRVREDHEDRDGEPFTWDAPPDDGHPGEPINCRCYAEPDLSDLGALLDA